MSLPPVTASSVQPPVASLYPDLGLHVDTNFVSTESSVKVETKVETMVTPPNTPKGSGQARSSGAVPAGTAASSSSSVAVTVAQAAAVEQKVVPGKLTTQAEGEAKKERVVVPVTAQASKFSRNEKIAIGVGIGIAVAGLAIMSMLTVAALVKVATIAGIVLLGAILVGAIAYAAHSYWASRQATPEDLAAAELSNMSNAVEPVNTVFNEHRALVGFGNIELDKTKEKTDEETLLKAKKEVSTLTKKVVSSLKELETARGKIKAGDSSATELKTPLKLQQQVARDTKNLRSAFITFASLAGSKQAELAVQGAIPQGVDGKIAYGFDRQGSPIVRNMYDLILNGSTNLITSLGSGVCGNREQYNHDLNTEISKKFISDVNKKGIIKALAGLNESIKKNGVDAESIKAMLAKSCPHILKAMIKSAVVDCMKNQDTKASVNVDRLAENLFNAGALNDANKQTFIDRVKSEYDALITAKTKKNLAVKVAIATRPMDKALAPLLALRKKLYKEKFDALKGMLHAELALKTSENAGLIAQLTNTKYDLAAKSSKDPLVNMGREAQVDLAQFKKAKMLVNEKLDDVNALISEQETIRIAAGGKPLSADTEEKLQKGKLKGMLKQLEDINGTTAAKAADAARLARIAEQAAKGAALLVAPEALPAVEASS